MKKKIIAFVVVSGLALASVASANWGHGWSGGPGNCPQMQMQNLEPAAKEKMDKFFADTSDLRKQMVVKQAEKRALMRSEKPDPAVAGKLAGELYDLRTTMHQKAVAAGVDQYLPARGPMMMGHDGEGFGPGHGRKGGRGFHDCQGPNRW